MEDALPANPSEGKSAEANGTMHLIFDEKVHKQFAVWLDSMVEKHEILVRNDCEIKTPTSNIYDFFYSLLIATFSIHSKVYGKLEDKKKHHTMANIYAKQYKHELTPTIFGLQDIMSFHFGPVDPLTKRAVFINSSMKSRLLSYHLFPKGLKFYLDSAYKKKKKSVCGTGT